MRPLVVPGQLEPWGAVVLPPGNTFRVVAEVRGLVNLGLLSAPEQDQVEDAWRGLLRSLDFPLQICIQSRPVEVPGLAGVTGANGLAAYAEAYGQHLGLWSQHSVHVRRVFLVVPADGQREAEVARELERRVRILARGIERWATLRVLGPDDALMVLASYWRKGKAPIEPPNRWDWDRLAVEGVSLKHVRAAVLETEGEA